MPKRKYNNLMQQLQSHIDAANAARAAGNESGYRSSMDAANALRPQIEQLQADIQTMELVNGPGSGSRIPDSETITNMANTLRSGGRVFLADLRNALHPAVSNAVTLSGSIAMPTGTAPSIRGGDRPMTDITPRTDPVEMEGTGSLLIPYVKSEIAAKDGNPVTNSGNARDTSDPAFGYVRLTAHEVTITTYVDRNMEKLSPAKFLEKVLQLAERARIRKINSLIMLGDGQATPEMQGIVNSKDKDGTSMVVTKTISAIDENTLAAVVFGYGGNEDLGYNPELHLHKNTLEAFAAISGTNEKQSVYKIVPDGTGSSGYLSKGDGVPVRYVLDNNLSDIATATAGKPVLAYGDPINYGYGRYGNAIVHLDYSYKAGERMITVLVDDLVAGGVIVKDGFVVYHKAAAAG